jgi:integrase
MACGLAMMIMTRSLILTLEGTRNAYYEKHRMADVFGSLKRAPLLLAERIAGIDGASSHSGRRTFLTNLANKGTAIHLLKTLAGHRSIQTTASYLYSSPSQLKAAVELA